MPCQFPSQKRLKLTLSVLSSLPDMREKQQRMQSSPTQQIHSPLKYMEIKVGKTWVFGIFFNAIFSFNPFPIFQYFSWTLIFLFSPFTLIWQFPVDKLIHCEAWFSLLMPYSSERECQIFSCILYKTRYLSWQDIQSSRISSSTFPGFTWERWCKQ